jgi:prolyl-tRNA synthetase
MKTTQLVGKTLREDPKDAKLVSHKFLLRGAYIRQVASGIYSLLPVAKRVVRKIENIIRDEMDLIGGQEILLPVVMPRELWEEAGRYSTIGNEMLRIKDRNGNDMLLGMTHEEAVVHLARTELSSYKQLPSMLYQIQTKFRDEARSRGGLVRVREFTMKDAYSFHTDEEDMLSYYDEVHKAYVKIFKRSGLTEFIDVASDTGMMGGGASHEFMLLSEAGEDTLFVCSCGYKANKEVAKANFKKSSEEMKKLEKVATPGKKTIEEVSQFLKVSENQTAKAVFYVHEEKGFVFVLIRGDLDVNENKLKKIVGFGELRPAHDEEIEKIGAVPGYASPMGLDSSKFKLLVDESVVKHANLVTGANEEDTHYVNFNLERDLSDYEVYDIASPLEGSPCVECGTPLKMSRGIEIGNIFQLGDKYSKPMSCNYLDKNGKAKPMIMGCYGIGVGRLMASVIEEKHDDWGPIWPITIAPWQVQILSLDMKKPGVREASEELYNSLIKEGVEVLWDDRNEKAGVQFKDADLRGIPFRIILSPRNLKKDEVEFKIRGIRDGEFVAVSEIKDKVLDLIKKEFAKYNNG